MKIDACDSCRTTQHLIDMPEGKILCLRCFKEQHPVSKVVISLPGTFGEPCATLDDFIDEVKLLEQIAAGQEVLKTATLGMRHSFCVSDRESRSVIDRCSEELVKKIEGMVFEWVKSNEDDDVLQIDFEGGLEPLNFILFSRSTIFVKFISNGWQEWRVATSTSWPHMIAFHVRDITDNACMPWFQMPNEVRGGNYSEEFRVEMCEMLKTIDTERNPYSSTEKVEAATTQTQGQ